MAIPINEFWKQAVVAQVFSREEAQQLHQTFAETPGAKHANAVTLAEWLISQSLLTRYHAKMLLSGKTGPCVVGPYKIFDRISGGVLAGLFKAAHAQTGAGVLMFAIDPPLNPAASAAANQVAAGQLFQARFGVAAPVVEYLRLETGEPRCWLVVDDISTSMPTPAATKPAATNGNTAQPAASAPSAAIASTAVAPSPTTVAAPQVMPGIQINPTPKPVVAAARPQPVIAKQPSATSPTTTAAPTKVVNKPVVEFSAPVLVDQTDAAGASPALAAYAARRRKKVPWVPIAGGAALIAAVAFGVVLLQQAGNKPEVARRGGVDSRPASSGLSPAPKDVNENNTKPAPNTNAGKTSKGGNSPTQSTTVVAADDGESLWASPTQGPPVDLRYLGPGAQLFLIMRPSSLLGTEEGERIFAALGPWGEAAADFVQRTIGKPLSEIERILVAWYPTDGDLPLTSYVVTLRQAASEAELLQAWHQPKAVERRGVKYYTGAGAAYFIPAAAGGRVFAMAPPALMEEIVGHEGPPLLRKEMEKLLRDTDDTRHFNLLLYPNFLFADGATVLSGSLGKLKGPLKDYFGEDIQAAGLSLHVTPDDSFYELRTMGTIDVSTLDRANLYRQRLQDLPLSVESYLAQLNPQRYGSMVLIRMPRMIGELANYSRVAEENGQSVLRCYLPVAAAHNLVLAAELALAEQPGGVAVSAVGPAQPAAPTTVADKLKQKISLSFPRNTLEKCMEMLGEETGIAVHILGADLQLEGITKNQSFGLDEREQPAEQILQKVMLLANPDGKLVYVIKPGDDGTEQLFITTRAAVAKRGDKLPAALEQPPAGK